LLIKVTRLFPLALDSRAFAETFQEVDPMLFISAGAHMLHSEAVIALGIGVSGEGVSAVPCQFSIVGNLLRIGSATDEVVGEKSCSLFLTGAI
jgi:hypothetical protein